MKHTIQRTVVLKLALILVMTSFMVGCANNKMRLESGSLAFLKQQSAVHVEYDYDGMRVGVYKKKSVSEQAHIDKKVTAYNQKTPGKGDAWRKEWEGNRAMKYQPKFEQLLNKVCKEDHGTMDFGAHKEAPYTLTLKVKYLEPGYHIGFSAKPALLTADAIFAETGNRANQVAVVSCVNMVGMDAMGFAFDEGWRMQESFAMTGKRLGGLVRSKTK